MEMSEWHARFTEQVGWSADLRRYLYEQVNLSRWRRLLDVGCGTGALLPDFTGHPGLSSVGIDLDPARLTFAAGHCPEASFSQADALYLPFVDGAFDGALCHYLLLWVHQPVQALAEMARVVRTGGWVLALAEPDHSARIDWPEDLAALGERQTGALKRQGADIQAGRKLGGWLKAAGLELVENGILGGQWSGLARSAGMEWQVIGDDLSLDENEMNHWRQRENEARAAGERTLFVPVFYAIGRVPAR